MIIIKTLPQISKEISVPVTSLRYKIAPYDEYIPFVKGNKGREYGEEAENVIRQINEYITANKTSEEILAILSITAIRDVAVITEQLPEVIADTRVYDKLTALNDNITRLVEQLARDKSVRQEISDIRLEMSRLKSPVKWYHWEYWKNF